MVDAGDDQVGARAEQPEVGKADAVDRRALRREAGGPVVELDLLHPDGRARRDAARGAAAVRVRRDHSYLDPVELQQGAAQLVQAASADSVVVCEQDEHP
jgi:hypothetical protein